MSAVTNAIAAWLLTYAVHSTLLLGAAVIVSRRIRSTASRDLVWKVAAFGALLSSALQSVVVRDQSVEPLAGRWEIPSFESAAEPIRSADLALPDEVRAAERDANQKSQSALVTTAPPVATRHIPAIAAPSRRDFTLNAVSWQSALVGLWLGGVLVSLLGLSRRYARAHKRFARRFDVADPEILAAVNVLCARIGLHRRVRVTRCEAAYSPVALGGNEICLPEALIRVLPAQQRTSMLAHELAHLDRNDPAWLAAFGWLECVLFFQPLNRVARKGFQEAAEHLCDQYALQHTESPIALALCLAEVARWLRGDNDALPYPTMGESPSPLVDRVKRVLSGVREPVTTTLRARWSAVGGVLAFAVMAPVVTDLPSIAKPSSTFNQPQQDTDPISAVVRLTADGVVRFAFTTRPSICGTGEERDGTRMFALKPDGTWQPAGRADVMALYVWDRGQLMRNDLGVDGTWTTPCKPGPARIDLTVRNGRVQAIDLSVAEPAPRLTQRLTDLGTVRGEIAVRYLTVVAQQGSEVGRRALIAASLTPDYSAGKSVGGNAITPTANQAAPRSPNPISSLPQDKLSLLQDKSQPLNDRLRVLDRLRDDPDAVATILRFYDSVPDRAMRVELIDWLSRRENAPVRDKLMTIVRDAVVLEEQQAALHALERSADAEARALSQRYRQKQQSQRDDIANAHVYNFTFPGATQGDLARTIAAAPDGIVHVTYKARPEACGSGIDEDGAGMFALLPTNDWHPGGPDMAAFYSFDRDDFTRLALSPNPSWIDKCVNGPVHLLLDVRDGAVTNLRIAVGPAPLGVRITTEMGGPLTGPEAANYLIELAGRAGQSIASNAILAAVMAEGNPLLYDKLIRIAVDLSRPDRVRRTALHWVALEPAPGAREAIRRNADRLPRDGDNTSPVGEPPSAALGDYNARLSSVQGMSLDVVLRVLLDERQPLETRKKAIKWAEDKDISAGALAGLYDRLENRELRLFLVQFLADCDDESTARKLVSIAETDNDNEIRQAARTSLSRQQNAVAKAYRR